MKINRWIIIIILIVGVALIVTAILRLLTPQVPFQVQLVPTGTIRPYDPVTVIFTTDPKPHNCTLTSQDVDSSFYSTKIVDKTLVATPEIWPPGETLQFNVSCDQGKVKAQFSLVIKTVDALTTDEKDTMSRIQEAQTALQLKSVNTTFPYLKKFPITRATYTIYFLADKSVLYVVLKNGQQPTAAQQQTIITTERPTMTTLGVPETTQFTFQQQ